MQGEKTGTIKYTDLFILGAEKLLYATGRARTHTYTHKLPKNTQYCKNCKSSQGQKHTVKTHTLTEQ